MAADVSITVEPRKSGDELRAEFRMAQRRRLLKGGVTLWRDTDFDGKGPQAGSIAPSRKDNRNGPVWVPPVRARE
jgi:hypothetical protein